MMLLILWDREWRERRDSNLRPPIPYSTVESGALPLIPICIDYCLRALWFCADSSDSVSFLRPTYYFRNARQVAA